MQLYVSFFAYTFDILFFIALTFVIPQLAHNIYPAQGLGVSLIVSWGGFAAGSLTRPFGAAIFGRMADARGRKAMLYVTLIGASAFTALLAAMPTYAQVGILAPVIFVGLRLIAGVFIGGLIAGGLVFGTENFPERFRGLMTGFAESGGSWAHVIGSAWLLLIGVIFSAAAFTEYGWRAMFLVSIIPLVIVLPVLHYTPESAIYATARRKGRITKTPLRKLLVEKSKVRNVFYLSALMSIGMLGYDNMTENTFPTFLKEVNHITPISHLATVVLIGAVFGVIGSVLGGAISQKTGRKPLAIVTGIILIGISYLYMHLGSLPGTSIEALIITLIPFYFFASIGKADLSLYLNEAFPTEIRGSALGLNWNIGYGLAGVWPIIISAFIAVYGIGVFPLAQFVGVLILAIVYVVASIFSEETIGRISKEKTELESEAGKA